MKEYPWYDVVDSEEPLLQGDFIDSCPVIIPTSTVIPGKVSADAAEYDVIVMSQSCDLLEEKIDIVLVCPIWSLTEFGNKCSYFQSSEGKETLRRGNAPGYHLLNKCKVNGFQSDYKVVDFRTVFGVPIECMVRLARERDTRLRLLPPYREHLSQAFARFFMRVGLPADIPPFKSEVTGLRLT